MTYILKHELTMGGLIAMNENVEEVTEAILRRIDAITETAGKDYDITRSHVEQALKEHKDWVRRFPVSASLGDTF